MMQQKISYYFMYQFNIVIF